MDRITNEHIARALAYLARAFDGAGLPLPDGVTLELRAPYGQCLYVVTADTHGGYAHDVPGFMTDTAGFTSKRDAYDAIQRAARTLDDLAPRCGRAPFDGTPYRRAS